jgi:hypothetical protein
MTRVMTVKTVYNFVHCATILLVLRIITSFIMDFTHAEVVLTLGVNFVHLDELDSSCVV